MANPMSARDALEWLTGAVGDEMSSLSDPELKRANAILTALVEAHEARVDQFGFSGTRSYQDAINDERIALDKLRSLERGEEAGRG